MLSLRLVAVSLPSATPSLASRRAIRLQPHYFSSSRFGSVPFAISSSTPSMAPPTHLFDPVPDPRPDGGDRHENGAAISRLFREGGPGTTVLLRPGQTYVLHSQVDLSHPGTTLATEGYPEFSTGRQAILETRGEKEAGAVRLFQLPRTALKRVHVRGCRGWGPKAPTPDEAEKWKKEGRLGWIEGGGALIWAGGPEAYEQTVEGCRIEDPRGWTGVRPTLVPNGSPEPALTNLVFLFFFGAAAPRRLCAALPRRQ